MGLIHSTCPLQKGAIQPCWCHAVAELGLSRTPGRVLSIDVYKLTVQKIHENINGKIDNIQEAPSRSNIFILLQQLIQVLLQQLIQIQR